MQTVIFRLSIAALACIAFNTHFWAQAAPTPPTVRVKVFAGAGAPCSHPWGLTINPAPVGGKVNQLVTTSAYSYYRPGYGFAYNNEGTIDLQIGRAYTFSLSDAFGGGWYDPNGSAYGAYAVRFYNVNDSTAGVSLNWYSYPSNPWVGYLEGESSSISYVYPSTLSSLRWTYVVTPWLRLNIEDNTFNPPITTYVSASQKLKNGRLPISKDYFVWSIPQAPVSVSSSRGGWDTLSVYNENTDSTGLFKTTLTTARQADPVKLSATIRAANNLNFPIETPLSNFLPAKCRTTYTCSVYYTPKESGFTTDKKFDVTLITPQGMTNNYKFKQSFVKAVRQEGYGLIQTPFGNNKYLCFHPKEPDGHGNYIAAHFDLQPTVLGTGNKPLRGKVSCAVNTGLFPMTAKLTFQQKDIKQAFGNDTFVVADVGHLTNDLNHDGFQVDLYWGEDDPKKAELGSPSNCSYNLTTGIPVIVRELPAYE